MKDVVIKLYEVQEGITMLYVLEIINRTTYEHLAGGLKKAFDEALRIFETEDKPQEAQSFTDCENYVNKHINLADTETLIKELERRGLEIKNNE